jgi:hypothetical protein
MMTVQPIACFPPEEGSAPVVATILPPADPAEPALVKPSGTPTLNVKRKIVVKPPLRDKNQSSIDVSEATMLDNNEPSRTEVRDGTNAD